jgi:hypothetical protein
MCIENDMSGFVQTTNGASFCIFLINNSSASTKLGRKSAARLIALLGTTMVSRRTQSV